MKNSIRASKYQSIKVLVLAGLIAGMLASPAQAEPNWIEINCNRSSSFHQGHLVNLENLVDIERTGDTTLRLSYYGHRSLFEIECDSRYHAEEVMELLRERIGR